MASRHRSPRRGRVDRPRAARLAIPFAIPVVLALVVGAVIVVNDDGGGGRGSLAPTAQQSPLRATQNPTVGGGGGPPGRDRQRHDHHRRGQRELRHRRARERAPRAGAGDAVPADRPGRDDAGPVRVRDVQCHRPGGVRPGDDPGPRHRQALGLQPAGDHPGHRPGGDALGAEPPGRRDRHDRLRVQRHRPLPGRRHADRAQAGQLPQRPDRIDLRPGVVLQRRQLLQRRLPGRARGQAEGAVGGHVVEHGGERRRDRERHNVTTQYLLNPATGQTAQDTASNAGNLQGATLLLNGSDNTLLDQFIDPVLGCAPYMAPDLANNDLPTTSQALDELLANANQPKTAALIPENDEMVLAANNTFDAVKTDMYRAEVGQAPIDAADDRSSSPEMYCQYMIDIQTPFLAANQALLESGQPPVANVGDNLLTFLANRLNMSFTNLACQNFGLTNPVTVTLNAQGIAVAATFNTTMQTAHAATVTDAPGMAQRMGRAHHQLMNPSGM